MNPSFAHSSREKIRLFFWMDESEYDSLNKDYKTCNFINNDSKVINVDDLSDDEINEIENYISFIRYKKNNGL